MLDYIFPLPDRGRENTLFASEKLMSSHDGVRRRKMEEMHLFEIFRSYSADLEAEEPERPMLPVYDFARRRECTPEEHQLLISEVAFALLISLAGLARCRVSETESGLSRPNIVDATDSTMCRRAAGFNFHGTKAIGAQEELEMKNNETVEKRSDGKKQPIAPTLYHRRMSIKVEHGDTLSRLAEYHFHDKLIAWLIADMNRGLTREESLDNKRIVRLKLGQQLTLPCWKDVAIFYGCAGDRHRREIITIIEDGVLYGELNTEPNGKLNGKLKSDALGINVQLRRIVGSPPPIASI